MELDQKELTTIYSTAVLYMVLQHSRRRCWHQQGRLRGRAQRRQPQEDQTATMLTVESAAQRRSHEVMQL